MCEQQYFFEYVLGWRGPSNKKADKGTIVHKVLEILAIIKKGQQENIDRVDDDIVKNIDVNNYDIDKIYNKVYSYYTSSFSHHDWLETDRKDCRNWIYKALSYNDGMFDPRNRDIIMPEQRFDISIDKNWAKFKYAGMEGNLALKGTIDLITQVSEDTLEIIDWKTGRRLDWATGQEKTQEKLEKDPQLKIYHYALSKLYPQINNFILTIFFINDGGAFSVFFDKSNLYETENMLREKYEYIKNTTKPRLRKSWICNKLCHFGKTTFENTHIHPLQEYRDGQICNIGQTMTKCEQVSHDIDVQGIAEVVDNYTMPGYTISTYKAPGETD